MGASESKADIRNQHQRDVEDDRRKRIQAGEQQKREQDAQLQRERNAQREENQREIEEAARENLEKVNAEIAEMEKYKEKQKDEMTAWKAKAREQAKKENEEMEAEAKIEMEKRLKEHAEEEAKLEKKLEALNEARAQLLKTSEDGFKQRTNMQNTHDQLTDKKRTEHQTYLMKKREEVYQHRKGKEDDLKALKEAGRANRVQLTTQSLKMISNSVQGGTNLVNEMAAVSAHDEFRLNCDTLRMYFKGFTDAYDLQSATLAKVASAMRWKKPLEQLPQQDVIQAAFNEFMSKARDLGIPDNFRKLQEPLDAVIMDADSIDESITKIIESITGYIGLVQKNPRTDKEEETLENCHIEVKQQIGLIKANVAKLVKQMRQFVIPVSTAVADEINRQGAQLGVETQEMLKIGSAGQKAVKN